MILCIGTTPTVQRTMVFDRFALDEVNRAAEVHEYASGKAVNVARVLATLGERAMVVGFAGGVRGDVLRADLDARGLQTQFATCESQTRLCTTILDKTAGTTTELVENAGPVTDAECAHLEEIIDLWLTAANDPRLDVMVFSGTLAPGVPADFIARWADRGPWVVVDAKGDPLRQVLETRHSAVVAKLNRAEFAETVGRPLKTDAELMDAMNQFAPPEGALIVTMGAAGALCRVDGAFLRVHVPKVAAVNPIGSGDAFCAGLASRLWGDMADAIRLGAACSVANAVTPLAGQVRIEDLARFQDQIVIERAG